jgi:LAO/AO transport system kinase
MRNKSAIRSKQRVGPKKGDIVQDIVTRLLASDRRALARMITLIENESPQVYTYLAELHAHSGKARIIGITGAPGAGKSSLVARLVRELRRRDQKVGVIAVDPSSPFSGGAILGDRIRMMDLAGDPNIFIRSMASRGNLGGLAMATRDVVRALDAAGYDPILIETVGTGQAEVEVMRTAQSVLVVVAPGMGDDIQAIKAGILEIADIFVVSKADKPGADQAAAELAMLLSLDSQRRVNAQETHPGKQWRVPILKTSALKVQGISELVDATEKHQTYLRESGTLMLRIQAQTRNELESRVQQMVLKKLHETVSPEEWQTLTNEIARHERDPYQVATKLLARLHQNDQAREE